MYATPTFALERMHGCNVIAPAVPFPCPVEMLTSVQTLCSRVVGFRVSHVDIMLTSNSMPSPGGARHGAHRAADFRLRLRVHGAATAHVTVAPGGACIGFSADGSRQGTMEWDSERTSERPHSGATAYAKNPTCLNECCIKVCITDCCRFHLRTEPHRARLHPHVPAAAGRRGGWSGGRTTGPLMTALGSRSILALPLGGSRPRGVLSGVPDPGSAAACAKCGVPAPLAFSPGRQSGLSHVCNTFHAGTRPETPQHNLQQWRRAHAESHWLGGSKPGDFSWGITTPSQKSISSPSSLAAWQCVTTIAVRCPYVAYYRRCHCTSHLTGGPFGSYHCFSADTARVLRLPHALSNQSPPKSFVHRLLLVRRRSVAAKTRSVRPSPFRCSRATALSPVPTASHPSARHFDACR